MSVFLCVLSLSTSENTLLWNKLGLLLGRESENHHAKLQSTTTKGRLGNGCLLEAAVRPPGPPSRILPVTSSPSSDVSPDSRLTDSLLCSAPSLHTEARSSPLTHPSQLSPRRRLRPGSPPSSSRVDSSSSRAGKHVAAAATRDIASSSGISPSSSSRPERRAQSRRRRQRSRAARTPTSPGTRRGPTTRTLSLGRSVAVSPDSRYCTLHTSECEIRD